MLRRSVCSTYQRIAAEKENEYDSIQIKCDQLMQEKLTIQKQFSEEKEKLNAQINYLQKINSLQSSHNELQSRIHSELSNKYKTSQDMYQSEVKQHYLDVEELSSFETSSCIKNS
jgi:predicted transcriptional regulator